MPDALGVGIIGCGRAGLDLHLPALKAVPGLEVRGLCDADPARLERAAGLAGAARRYQEHAGLLADPRVDAVAVCVPAASHAEVALAALEAGKHVLVEKPLALTPQQADRMVERAAGTRLVTTVGFNLRAHRLVREARRIVAGGELGPIEMLRSIWTTGCTPGHLLPAWRSRRASGGGVLLEIGVHHVDLWRYLLGSEIESVSAQIRSELAEDDTAVLTGRMAGGTLVSSALSQRTGAVHRFEIYGRLGWLSFSCYEADSLRVGPPGQTDGGLAGRLRRLRLVLWRLPATLAAARRGGDFLDSYRRQWRFLLDSVLTGSPPLSTWEDGRRSLLAVLAAASSAERGQLVPAAAPALAAKAAPP